MIRYEEEYYHNIRRLTNNIESIAESLEAINKTLEKLTKVLESEKEVVSVCYDKGIGDYLKKISGEYNSTTCPYCGSTNVQYMYGTITPFNYTNNLQTMSSHYMCLDCHKEFDV